LPQDQDTEKNGIISPNIFAQPLSIFGIPVDRETIFSDHKKIYKPRIEKRQRKLIVKVTALKYFLQPQERIRCLTTGYSPVSVLEQVLTGPAFLFFKRAILVFTDNRILHVRTSFSRKAGNSISQIMYGDCRSIVMKGRALIVSYKNGQTEVFNYIGRREKKKVKALIEELTLKLKDPAVFKSRVALCPKCTNVLKTRIAFCENCKLKFRTPLAAGLLSLAVPGGGYLYCSRILLGSIAAVVEVAAIGFLVVQWLNFRKGMPLEWSILLAAAGILILEKIVATFHATQMTQDYIPKTSDFEMGKS